MGLSGRELTLILRARDEASRTLGRLSSNMSKLDRDAQRVSQQSVRQSQANLLQMQRNVHDIEEAYQRQTLAARESYYTGKMTGRQYQQAMLAAQKTRVNDIADNRILRQQQEDYINAEREHLRLLGEERDMQRHLASTRLAQGTAAMAYGAVITYVGVRGVEAMASNIQATMEYETQVARTKTQVDKAGASLKQISDIGKEIADTVPVAFEQIQPALYDIFSSIDTNVEGSRTLLKQFAKDTVGGQTDMQTATRANLAIMNAYGISVADAADVSDFMFRLVQKGVGTYDEFAKTIGRAIPSAAKAGQSYQTLGAMLAFMTRNGVSAAMAASSSARALDAISKTKVGERLHDMGIEVKNTAGEFRKLPDILDDMNDIFGKMTTPERAKALEKLFLGAGGTIQARRFFDMYFKNSKEFNQRTKEMSGIAGEAEKAFNEMAESPQAKLQELKNNWMLLRIEMGEHLLPAALKVVGGFNKILDAYRGLDDNTKKAITYFLTFSAILLTLVGILTVIGGAVWAFTGAVGMLGMTAGTAIAKLAGFSVGLILIADGLRRMSSAATDGERDIAGFEIIAGGALMGFMAGGPIGLAVGAGIGAVAALTAEIITNKEAAAKSIGTWEDYAATLDQTTAAMTKQTRAFIYDNLQKSGMLKDIGLLGIGQTQLVNSLMGEEKAVKNVGDAFSDAKSFVKDFYENNAGYAAGGMARINALNDNHIGQIEDLIEAYELEGGAIRKSVDQVREKSAVVNELPKDVITKFSNVGVPENIKQLKAFVHQMGLTPKQIKTIAKIERIDLSKKQLADLTEASKKAKESLDKVGKAKPKPDTSFLATLGQAIKKGMREGSKQLDDFSKEVRDKTRRAKPDLDPFRKGLQTQLGGIKIEANRGSTEVGAATKNGFGGGFGGAILAWSAQVRAAVRAAINAGKAEAKAHSPSRETYDLGVDLIDGLVLAFKQKGDKPAHEAGKMMKKILAQIQKDLISQLGTEGFSPKMSQVLDIARSMLEKSLPKSLKGEKRQKKIKTVLGALNDTLKDDINKLERINKRLRQVKKDLETQINEVNRLTDIKNAFSQSIKDFGSFSSFSLENPTAATITAEMQKRVQQIAQFGKDLQTLKAMGFSQQVIDMILAMPIQDAIAYAAALVKATPEQLGTINAGAQAISGVGGLAETISAAMYQAGIDAAQALVDGLKEKEEDLDKIAKRLGHKIAQAIKDALGMKSPSKVALGIAHNFGDTLGRGLQDREKNLEYMSRRLAVAMQPDPSTTYTSRPVVSAYPGSTSTVHKTEQNLGPFFVQEQEPRAFAQKLGWELMNRTGL